MDGKIKALKIFQDKAEAAEDACKARHNNQEVPKQEDPHIVKMSVLKNTIQDEINNLVKGNYDYIVTIEDEIERIDKIIDLLNKDILQLDTNQRVDKRVVELKNQERILASEFENLESDLFVIETFIRTKVSMLEEKINSKFKHATFRMFTEQINEGLTECCDTTFNGVPYNSLNNGARINIGLDICNTLAEHFRVTLPVFLDNSEAVTEMFETSAQQIKLFVSKKDKVLRIENN